MSADTIGRHQTYGGWQREKVAFLFGLSASQAVLLCGAVLAAITPLAVTDMRAAVLLWPAAAVLASAALVRVAGRTGDEWAAGLVSHLMIVSRGQHRFAGGPFTPFTPAFGCLAAAERTETQLDLPGILAPLRILSVPSAARDLAVVENRHERTWTAVARVRFPGTGLSDSARRDQRVGGWGALLASLCTEGGPLTRVQALQRLVPKSGAALRSWHAAHLAPGAPELAVSVAGELLATATLTTTRREAYLAITMDGRRTRAQVRAAGGGDRGAAVVLVRHLRGLHQALGSADLTVEDWLGTRDLAEVIRTAYDPHSQPLLAGRRAAAAQAAARGAAAGSLPPGVSPDLAGPVYAEARAGTYLHDGAVSASYWVHSWPGQAYSTALGPLLGDGSHRRSFGMIFEPLSPRTAQRAVMRERTARHVAVRMRQRTGQIVPEHERAAMEQALGQDAEQAAGHGLVRFTGYATVTATDGTIEDACTALEADAAAARVELRRMWFAQDSGFALGALPLGLGLPQKAVVTVPAQRALAEHSLTPYVGFPVRKEEDKDQPERSRGSTGRSPLPPRRGWARPWGGRAAVQPPVPVYRGSTAQVQGLYPWLYGGSLAPAGAYLGIDCLTGGAFSCHPLAWLADGLVSNPNILVTGVPGAGKSATIKALGLRLMCFGTRMFVAGDLKNEYAPLARALGVEPVELGPGLPGRLNPLDAGPLGDNLPGDAGQLAERLAEIHRRRLVLLCSLAAMRLGRPLSPTEESAVSLAIHEASGRLPGPEGNGAGRVRGGARAASPTIPLVWAALRDPSAEMARELRVRRDSADLLREMIRPVTDAIGGMIRGSMAGLFDGPTTVRPDFSAPVQTVDLSRVADRGDETVAMILACVSSWAQAAVDEPGPARMIVRDELWRSLRIPALVRKVDSDLRLSRAQGTVQVLATHRLADFETAGVAGSAESAIATGLIASCDTRICLRQDTAPLAATREQIGLTDTECAHIASWSGQQTGRAVWKIGRAASAVVQVVLTPAERQLFWTNERMGIA